MKPAEPADFPQFESDLLKLWDEEKTFERSLDNRRQAERFSFYDGPPFANGLPHYGHVVAVTEKDAITRYKTMRGYYVPRRNGWDTHGLPVEYEVEKQLGISGKRQILDMGVDKFNQACRDSVFKYKQEWEDFFRRLGRWADVENSYATLDDDYIESVWWVLAELHRKGLVYRGFRCNPYCPRCATPLSNFEVNQNYKDNVPDPSVFVKFQLVGHPDKSLLAWTTTPWTLPANAALAVSADADYVEIELLADGDGWSKGEKLILAKQRLSLLDLKQAEYKIVHTRKGRDCAGTTYEPLYPEMIDQRLVTAQERKAVHQVYADDSVSLEDGTGILHVAPCYGETDLALAERVGLPKIQSVDSNGQMLATLEQIPDLKSIVGLFFKDADAHIIADLAKKGRIFAAETFEHTYPFCWRCETPLLYYAMPSWFVKVSDLRDKLVASNQQINWVPEHIKQGRFGNWLAEARDWNFSRNRFWGAPLPIWVNEQDETDLIVIGSLEELRRLAKADVTSLHRPDIDQITIERDGRTYRRVEEVFDCWFESGAMPYAQDHYPFEHEAEFKQAFPAQFIAEGLDQTRGWFYTLHVLGTALFDQPAFKNVVVNGIVLAADGKKLSKRLKNYPPVDEVFNNYGADILRFFMMSSPVVAGEDVRFSEDGLKDLQRNLFLTLWNVYSFLTTYAVADGWQPPAQPAEPSSHSLLDRWLISRLNQLIAEVTQAADRYQIAAATRPIAEFVDDLSNWYLRRSRRRFWKNQDKADQAAAYATLHYALLRLSQLLAPWAPFISDKIYRGLMSGAKPASVHLTDWPEAGEIDQKLLSDMRQARELVQQGLAQRAEAKIKVRQPLGSADVRTAGQPKPDLLAMMAEELNVKTVNYQAGQEPSIVMNTNITHELKLEGLAREIVRLVQQARKEAGLKIDDKIELRLGADADLALAIKTHRDLIARETLAGKLDLVDVNGSLVPKRVENQDLTIELDVV